MESEKITVEFTDNPQVNLQLISKAIEMLTEKRDDILKQLKEDGK
jgi:hypothetical protein